MTRSLEPEEQGIRGKVANTLVQSCIGRRDTWPSLEVAKSDLLRSPFFRAWDGRVFDSLLQSGLGPVRKFITYTPVEGEDEGTIGLMTPRWAEATVFAGGPGMLVGYDKLSELREDMKVTFVMAEDASSYVPGPVASSSESSKADPGCRLGCLARVDLSGPTISFGGRLERRTSSSREPGISYVEYLPHITTTQLPDVGSPLSFQVMQEKPYEVAKAMHASLNGYKIEPDEKIHSDKAKL